MSWVVARYVSSRTIKSGSVLHELDIQDLTAIRRSPLRRTDRSPECRQDGSGVRVAREHSGQDDVPAVAVHRRRVLLAAHPQHGPGLLLDPQLAAGRRGAAAAARARCRGIAVPLRHRGRSRSSSATAATRACSPSGSGSSGAKQRQAPATSVAPSHRTPSALSRRPRARVLARSCAHTVPGRPLTRTWLDAAQPRSHRALGARPRRDPLARITPEAADVAEPLVDGRFYFAEVASVDGRRRPAGVQHPGRHRRPRLRLQRLRQSQHRVPARAARHGDGARHRRRTPSTSRPTTTAGSRSRRCCRRGSPTCSSTGRAASRSAWPRTSRRTTCARSRPVCSGTSTTRTRRNEELLARAARAHQGPGLPDQGPDRRHPRHPATPTAPVAARSRCARSSRSRRTPAAARAWSSPSCPTRSTPTRWPARSPSWPTAARSQGIADLRDDSSSRTGMRLVVVLKRDAVASVVRNNLYKHTQLQDTFGCNMLALVDGVPRTLSLDAFVRHWVTHQIEVIVRRTTLPAAQGRGARAHPARPAQGAGRASTRSSR